MPQVARFTISTPSRHPANQDGYEFSRHRYRPEYVNPPSWELNLAARPDGIVEDDNGRELVPPDIVGLRWTVRQVDGPFSKAISRKRSTTMLRATVRVPEPGTYDVTL